MADVAVISALDKAAMAVVEPLWAMGTFAAVMAAMRGVRVTQR